MNFVMSDNLYSNSKLFFLYVENTRLQVGLELEATLTEVLRLHDCATVLVSGAYVCIDLY